MSKIVLITKSRRKIAEFSKLGIPFEAFQPKNDEPCAYGALKDPSELVVAQARGKLFSSCGLISTRSDYYNHVLVALDSVAYQAGILGKPKTPEEAIERLKRFSGNIVEAYTGIYVSGISKDESRVVRSVLAIRDLSGKEISDYVADDPAVVDTSLGFNPDHRLASDFIVSIEGPKDHVYGGVPLEEIAKILRGIRQ